MGATLGDVADVRCEPSEAAYFDPPPGLSCGEYAGAFVEGVQRGYLVNPDAMANCGYCSYASGKEYLATLNIGPGDKWRDFGVFLVLVAAIGRKY